MGFFSEIDIEIREAIAEGATREQIARDYPMLREDEVEMYFADDCDSDVYPEERDYQFDDSMDGDEASALASIGWGTDEDYGCYGEEY